MRPATNIPARLPAAATEPPRRRTETSAKNISRPTAPPQSEATHVAHHMRMNAGKRKRRAVRWKVTPETASNGNGLSAAAARTSAADASASPTAAVHHMGRRRKRVARIPLADRQLFKAWDLC